VAARLTTPERADDDVVAVLPRLDAHVVGIPASPMLGRDQLDAIAARLTDGDLAVQVADTDPASRRQLFAPLELRRLLRALRARGRNRGHSGQRDDTNCLTKSHAISLLLWI